MLKTFDFKFISSELAERNNLEYCPELLITCQAEISGNSIVTELHGVSVSVSLDGEPFPLSYLSVKEQMGIQREAERLAEKDMHNWVAEQGEE